MDREIIERLNSNQITKNIENCIRCGLPQHVCICETIERGKISLHSTHIHIVMHEKEVGRSTNTARLVKYIFEDNVHLHIWKRKEPIGLILQAMERAEACVILLFPASEISETVDVNAVLKRRGVDIFKEIHLVVIDGTWQEAGKIIRKTPYLSDLPRLQLTGVLKSSFSLRKNQKEGNLCTSEAVSEALETLGEKLAADHLRQVTCKFIENYEKGRSGHGL